MPSATRAPCTRIIGGMHNAHRMPSAMPPPRGARRSAD